MITYKCKICGGSLDINSGDSFFTCQYCGSQLALPRLNNSRTVNLYERANHLLQCNEFDKASSLYEELILEDNTDCEAYWSLVLCRFGVQYVDDPKSGKRIPTINRAQYTSIYNDVNYQLAIKHADPAQRKIYERQAEQISTIQRAILDISQREEPYDVFICYKETDENGKRTRDSVLAHDLYNQLCKEGYKVFYSRITLESKLGSDYEPYIFAALNSAKVMVVIGTCAEHLNSAWVKNEWSRYLSIVNEDPKKVLIPAFRDMDPYDMPEELSHLQAQDMSRLGFMQDLIHGINKIIDTETCEAADADNNNGRVNDKKKRKKGIFLTFAILAVIALVAVFAVIAFISSSEQIQYDKAITLMESNKFEEALDIFKTIKDYENSADKIIECETEISYNNAVSLMENGELEKARDIFITIADHRDSKDKLSSIERQLYMKALKNIKIGDTIKFGSYEQDNDLSNGAEEIEWIVLDIVNGKALVTSKYALDCQKFNEDYESSTWETCTIRRWLNSKFISTAFSEVEKGFISEEAVPADPNPEYNTHPGNDTIDKVFLLSAKEATKYFPTDADRNCIATEYANAQGAFLSENNVNCVWWLRTPGKSPNRAAGVFNYGIIYSIGLEVNDYDNAVRPAMWIDIEP